MPDNTRLATALWCAEQGWPVHPLLPGRKIPLANCTACRTPGHTPAGCPCPAAHRWCHGFHAATLDTDRITRWWTDNPHHGVGVACGPARLVVIDIDTHPAPPPARDRIWPGIEIGDTVDLTGLTDGFDTLAVLAALRGQDNPAHDTSTLRVRTPSGGLHLWYRADATHHWRCSSGNSPRRALAWQVDIRAHGGYIVAPTTTTPTGTYQPLDGSPTPAPLPGWLAAELERTGHHRPHVPHPHSPHSPRRPPARAQQAVRAAGAGHQRITRIMTTVLQEIDDCGRVHDGAGFTAVLNRAAYTLGGLVAAGHITQDAATQALQEAAHAARPGQDRRSMQIIAGGMSAGLARPLTPGRRR
ncbi:bifunctional DNA primase/polymerase [Streptomyces sp. NPDC054945]